MRTPQRRRQRGISLVEALVAMVVMTFGTLAVLGVQATLRSNGDIAKQRSEAVRIGQRALEEWRAYTALDGDDEGVVYYDAIGDDTLTVDGTNASFSVTRVVPAPADDPRLKALVVDVTWQDRAGQTQSIRLRSAIAGVPPELSGTLAIPSGASILRNPGGRHPGIPPDAVPQEGGTSRFAPPGAATGVGWVFDNNTGYITQLCNGSTCTAFSARLLAGFIRFSVGGPPDAEIPASPRDSLVQVVVDQSFPESLAGSTVECYEDLLPIGYTPYYCAVPVATLTSWSGRSRLQGLDIAATLGEDDDGKVKVCRYTPFRNAHPTVPAQMRNDQHPLDYVKVEGALINQNFLVISAGDDDEPYDCPADDPDTPANGSTWRHQPAN